MSGIIMGALGGLGAGMAQTGQLLGQSALQDQQQAGQKDLLQMQSDLALQKEQAVEQMRANMATQQRTAMVDRIATAKQGIINGQLNKTYGDYDAALAGHPNSGTPLTPEQQAVIEQSQGMVAGEKDAAAQALASNPDLTVQAGVQTGDINPIDAAKLASSKDIAALRNENFKDRTDAMVQMREIAAKASVEAANIRAAAAEERAKSGGVSASMRTMLINSENANIKASTSEMTMLSRQLGDIFGNKPEDKAKRDQINERITELREEIKTAQGNKNAYMQDLGILKPSGSAGAASGATPTGKSTPNPVAGDPLGLFKK